MVQDVETSHKEKIEMYRLIDKERLIEMLIECNRLLHLMSGRQRPVPTSPSYTVTTTNKD